jgi:hypothetical protein
MHDDDVLTAAERRLRRVLRSDDDRLGDVITRALSAERRIRFAARARLIVAAFVAALILGTLLWRASVRPPAALTISGSGSVIVVTTEDGRRWLVDKRNDSPPRGHYAIAVPQ